MNSAEFPPGIDPEVWEVVDVPELNRRIYETRTVNAADWFVLGKKHFVRREPTPTMPVLPSEVRSIETQWADWIDSWLSQVTPTKLTPQIIANWLRSGHRPFGCSAGEQQDGPR